MGLLYLNLCNNSVGKNKNIVHLNPICTFSAFCYIFVSITLKQVRKSEQFSSFLNCVAVIKSVKFQIHMYKGFKVGIFRISPVVVRLSADIHIFSLTEI